MQQQHHPKDIRTYNKGANRDTEKELLSGDEGVYVDAHNMRPTSMDGDSGSIKKIKGEVMLFPLIDNRCSVGDDRLFSDKIPTAFDYCNIGSIEVNNNIVEFWANNNGNESLIRINGVIVLWDIDADTELGFSCDFPLQMDKDESCKFGTVFVTDNHVEPIYFDIEDLLVNAGMLSNDGRLLVTTEGVFDWDGFDFTKGKQALSNDLNAEDDEGKLLCSNKFFSEFNKEIFDISTESGLDIPVFVGLTDSPSGGVTFGNSGLPVGMYQYSIRYVSDGGERTQWSHSTGLIPVVSVLSDDNKYYSSPLTEAGVSDVESGLYAVNLKLRITNDYGYESIEIRRTSYNSGDILVAESGQDIIARINILPAPDKPINFFDNGAVPIEAVSAEDSIGINSVAKRAKGIRFHNNRIYLMNVELSDRIVPKNLSSTGDDSNITIGSTIQKINKDAYNNPKNFESYKTYLSKEGYKFGFVGYDVNGEITFVKGIGGYQLPDRRHELSGDSKDTSYNGYVETLNYNGVKSATHEVFEHWESVRRNQQHYRGRRTSPTAVHGSGQLEQHFTRDELGFVVGSSEKLTERNQGMNQNPTVYDINKVRFPLTPVQSFDNNPKCFGLDYYAKGVHIKGIDNVDSDEFKDIKSFSIVRTDSINHVVAQGIGVYKFNQSQNIHADSVKSKDSFVFYSPDTDGKIAIDPLLLDKIIKTPTNYKVEVSSPLGFFSDVYNHFPASDSAVFAAANVLLYGGDNRLNSSSKEGDNNVDQLLFARIQRDKNGDFSEINPQELNLGTDGGDGYKYVDFGKFRGDSYESQKSIINRTIKIKDASINPSGHGLVIDLFGDLYDNTNYNTNNGTFLSYSDPSVKNFHEPFYIVNIVRNTDAINLDLQSSEVFQETGTYIKKKSFIGTTNGVVNSLPDVSGQTLELTYERWEDTTPDVIDGDVLFTINNPSDFNNPNPVIIPPVLMSFNSDGLSKNNKGISGYQDVRRFIYIDGVRWVNIASLIKGEYTDAIIKLSNNLPYTLPVSGESIGGIFLSSTLDNIFWSINFRNPTGLPSNDKVFIPAAGLKVSVKYNSKIPIRVFGGDGNIGENIFNMVENNYISCPMPYPAYLNQDRVWVGGNTGFSDFVIENINKNEDVYRTLADDSISGLSHRVSKIRQMAVMFCCESRTNTNFLFSKNDPEVKRDGFFPNLNIDPSMAERVDFTDQANMSIPTNPSINIDFSRDSKFRTYTSINEFIVKNNETNFCAKAIWSLPKNVGQLDTPNLRTFPALNFYDLPESTGEIKMAWSANTGRGDNLYAITEEGVALLATNKRTLSESAGNQLGYIGDENSGITEHLWVSKTIGMDKQFWRTAAEYEDTLYWANKESVYRFDGNALQDIGKNKYHSRIYLDYLDRIDGGYNTEGKLIEDMTGFYDRYHNEYWLNFSNYRECPQDISGDKLSFNNGAILNTNTLVYSSLTDHWLGTFEYDFDRYVSIGNKSYGVKSDGTYELNLLDTINDAPITSHVLGISATSQIKDKEYIRIRVNSDVKPDSIEFFKSIEEFTSGVPLATLTAPQLKNYYGFEQYIPREIINRDRIQGRHLLFDMINSTEIDFKIVDTDIQYKTLK